MAYKITYRDGKEEDLEGYGEIDFGDDFVTFSGDDKEDVMIAKDLIAKIE
jgi:hypothetical protein